MKTLPFWTSVLIAMVIIFAGIAAITTSPDRPEEGGEGYLGPDSTEIMVFDFTDEPPMLITPSNGLAED